MTETTTSSSIMAEPQRVAALFSSMWSSSADPLLRAQEQLIVGMESTVTEWLHRRHEAVVDAQRLVARLRDCTDAAQVWRAQQDWLQGTLQRLNADAAACQQAMLQILRPTQVWTGSETPAQPPVPVEPSATAGARPARAKPFVAETQTTTSG